MMQVVTLLEKPLGIRIYSNLDVLKVGDIFQRGVDGLFFKGYVICSRSRHNLEYARKFNCHFDDTSRAVNNFEYSNEDLVYYEFGDGNVEIYLKGIRKGLLLHASRKINSEENVRIGHTYPTWHDVGKVYEWKNIAELPKYNGSILFKTSMNDIDWDAIFE